MEVMDQRRNEIVEFVNENQTVTFTQLKEKFPSVSEMTLLEANPGPGLGVLPESIKIVFAGSTNDNAFCAISFFRLHSVRNEVLIHHHCQKPHP